MSTVDDDIRRLLRQIDALEREVDAQRSAREQAKKEYRKYDRRIDDVNKAKNKLSRTFDGCVNDVRSRQSQLAAKLAVATSGLSGEALLTSDIRADLEKHTEGDKYSSQMHTKLNAELSRCRDELERAASAESACSGRIDSLLAQRKQLVVQAKEFAEKPDATVKVWKGYWY